MSGRKRWMFVKEVAANNVVKWTLLINNAELFTKEKSQQLAYNIRDCVAVSYAKEDAQYLCIE